MTHFTKLQSNVKGCKGDIPLSRKVVITGPNKSGKTSHISAVRLALTGKHPGCNIRQLKTFFELAHKDEDLVAHLTGAGVAARTAIFRDGGEGKPTQEYEVIGIADPEGALAVSNAGNLLSMGSDKMREAIFRRFVQVKGLPKPMHMDDTLEAVWDEASKTVSTQDPVEFLAEIKSALNKMKREANAQKKFVDKKTKETRGWLAAAGAGSEQIPELEGDLAKAQVAESSSSAQEALDFKKGQKDLAETQLKTALANLKAAKEGHAKITEQNEERRSQVEALSAEASEEMAIQRVAAELTDHLRGVRHLQDFAIEKGHKNCMMCLGPADPEGITKSAEALDAKIDSRKETRETSEAKCAEIAGKISALVSTINQKAQKANGLLSQFEYAVREAAGKVERLTAEIEGLAKGIGAAAEYQGRTSAEIMEELATLREAQRRDVQLGELLGESAVLQRSSANAKLLESEAAKLQEHLVHQASSGAEKVVNKYMPAGFKAVLDLDNMEWRVVGQDGRAHNKVSFCGAEENALTIGLALAWTEDSPVRIVTLDADAELKGYDKETFGALCDRLSGLVDEGVIDQVIMTWIRKDEVPKGWTVIDLTPESDMLAA